MAAPMPENYPATPKPAAPNTPVVQTEQEPARNKIFKPALIIFCIILIIVISEVGYLVFKGYNKTYLQPQATMTPTPTPVPSPPTLEDIQAGFPRTHISSDKARNFADRLDFLSPKLEFIQNASMNFVVAGTLVESSPERGETEGIEYVHRIILKTESGKLLTNLLTESELEYADIYLYISTGVSQIEIDEIRPGDFISLRYITNLLDPSPHSRLILEAIRED
jgi:hypothetical protein